MAASLDAVDGEIGRFASGIETGIGETGDSDGVVAAPGGVLTSSSTAGRSPIDACRRWPDGAAMMTDVDVTQLRRPCKLSA